MDKIIQLLQYWDQFQKERLGDDFSRFASWLNNATTEEELVVPEDYHVSSNVKIGFLLGNLIAFAEVWTKLAFKDLPIQNFIDFGMLKFVEGRKNPTKKEIAADSLQEQSTTFEAIKRLIKNGLFKEEADPNDGRVRRVRLTKKGKEVVELTMHQAFVLSDLLVGNLTEEEKASLIQLLTKLDAFHEDLYHNVAREKVAQYYNLT